MNIRRLVAAICASALVLVATSADAGTLVGPAFPPPGNVTFTAGASNPGAVGGKTNTYSNLNPSAYDRLFWGPSDASAVGISLDPGNVVTPGEFMNYDSADSNLAAGKLVFRGQTSLFDAVSGFHNIFTQLTISVFDSSSNPIAFTPSGSISGFTGTSAALAQITGTGFQVNLYAEGSYTNGSGYLNLDKLYGDANTTGKFENVSVSGGFFSDSPVAAESSTPLPAAALGGVVLLGGLSTRRRTRQARFEAQ